MGEVASGEHHWSGCFTPGKETKYQLHKRQGGHRVGEAPPGFEHLTGQPIVNRYNDWAIPAASCRYARYEITWGSEGMASIFIKLCTRWMRVVNLTTWVTSPLLNRKIGRHHSRFRCFVEKKTLVPFPGIESWINRFWEIKFMWSVGVILIRTDSQTTLRKSYRKTNLVKFREVVCTMETRKRQRSPNFPLHVESMCLRYSIQL